MHKKTKLDLTNGPLFLPMLSFVLPIMLTGILQILYNMADNIVVGQFSGDPYALGAVGSTSSITNLVLNFIMGIASGAGVVVAQSFGAKDDRALSRAVHTAMTFSVIGGLIFGAIGILISEPALKAMGTLPELQDNAVLYMRIICAGIPASAVYNYAATILRSVGDSKTPLIILSSSGIVNVILNLVFVIGFRMSVAGVALATILSQLLSAIVVVYILYRRKDKNYGLTFSKLGIEKAMLLRILRFGVPAGIQGSLFSISNVIITTAANSFTPAVVNAKTIAGNIDGLLYTALNSYMHASMTFTGQNYGAKKVDRIRKSTIYGVVQVLSIGTAIALVMLAFSKELSMLYIDKSADPQLNEEVLYYSVKILALMLPTYALCGMMETLAGALRGLGYSVTPMIVNLVGSCGSRILWVFLFFPMDAFHTITGLYLIYPISWILTSIAHFIVLMTVWRKLQKQLNVKPDVEKIPEKASESV